MAANRFLVFVGVCRNPECRTNIYEPSKEVTCEKCGTNFVFALNRKGEVRYCGNCGNLLTTSPESLSALGTEVAPKV